MLKTLLYFIAGNVATEVEKAAIAEAKQLAKQVIVNCARLVDSKHYEVDAVAGVKIPDAYSDHPNIIELDAHKTEQPTTVIEAISDAIEDVAVSVVHEGAELISDAIDAATDWFIGEVQPAEEIPAAQVKQPTEVPVSAAAEPSLAWPAATDGWGAPIPAAPVNSPPPATPIAPATPPARDRKRRRPVV